MVSMAEYLGKDMERQLRRLAAAAKQPLKAPEREPKGEQSNA